MEGGIAKRSWGIGVGLDVKYQWVTISEGKVGKIAIKRVQDWCNVVRA